MSRRIDKSSRNAHEHFHGKHRYEHWYIDNQVYFITARCRDGFHAFASEEAQQIFWQKLAQYCNQFGLELWFVSLMVNHYHLLGYPEDRARPEAPDATPARISRETCKRSAAGATHGLLA